MDCELLLLLAVSVFVFASCCPHRTMKCGIPILWLFNRNEITRMYIYYNSGYWSEVICNDKNRARCELLLHALIETPIAVIEVSFSGGDHTQMRKHDQK